VSFNLDSNGILNVTAIEKGGGKRKEITIKNDSGRLSQQEMERMINESEKFKEEDTKHAERVGAKNQLESYAYSLRSTLNDEKVKNKLDSEDRSKMEKKLFKKPFNGFMEMKKLKKKSLKVKNKL